MARVKFSPVISSVKGSVGSGTFQDFKGGASLRVKPNPRNSYSEDQYYARLYTKLVQEAWSGLSADEQASWQSFLDFVPNYQKNNSKVQLSGFNLFLKYNITRLHIGVGILTSYTFTPLASLILTPIVHYTGGVLYVTFQEAFRNDVSVILFKISPVLKTPSVSQKSKLRKIFLSSFTPPGVLTYNIFSNYVNKFGYEPNVGDKVLVGVTFLSAVAPIIQKETYFICTIQNI